MEFLYYNPRKETKSDCVKKANTKATKDKKYSYAKVIGQGSFGTVLRATDVDNEQDVAVKISIVSKSVLDILFRKQSSKQVEAKQEADMLNKLVHENIVELKDYFEFQETMQIYGMAIVMEYCSGGSLQAYLNAMEQINPLEKRKRWYIQLSSAVDFIHSKSIAHRDIKPDNVLLDWKEDLKIADVGIAKSLWEAEDPSCTTTLAQYYLSKKAGTPYYMAPEVLSEHYEKGCDVFSIGLVLLMIAAPADRNCSDRYPKVKFRSEYACLGRLMKIIPESREKSLEELFGIDFGHLVPGEVPMIKSMLKYNYKYRPTLKVIIEKSSNLQEKEPDAQPVIYSQPSNQRLQQNTEPKSAESWCQIM